MNKYRTRDGLSLIEAVMSLALGAIIVVPLAMVFSLAVRNWDEHHAEGEILYHARIAMTQITSELRYAVRVTNATDPRALEFYTRTLIDSDWAAETVKFEWPDTWSIKKYVDGGEGRKLAGTGVAALIITIEDFVYTLLKRSGDNLVPLAVSDPVDMADAVKIELTVEGPDNEQVSLESLVKLRNK